MPNDFDEDFLPRKPSASRPLELQAPVQYSVPEVSLLFDQNKNPSLNTQSSSEENTKLGHSEKPGSIPQQIQSYNTWKAKNAQALLTITGTLNRPDSKKQVSDSRKLDDKRSKHTISNEIAFQGAEAVTSSPLYVPEVPRAMFNKTRTTDVHCQPTDKEDVVCRPVGTTNQHRAGFENPHWLRHYPQNDSNTQYKGIETNVQMNKMTKCQNTNFAHSSNVPLTMGNPYLPKKTCPVPNTYEPYEPVTSQERDVHGPNYCQSNMGCCDCREKNARIGCQNGKEQVGGNGDPLDFAKINNQNVMDLYQIIHLQNEQILMLQQQVKQVLQIHLECEKRVVSEKQNSCQNCACENRHFQIDTCTKLDKDSCNCKLHENSVQRKPSSSSTHKNKSKRSVGVMTTPLSNNSDDSSATDSNDEREAIELSKGKKLQQKIQNVKSSSGHHKKSKKKTEERKGRAQYVSPHEKKKNRVDGKTNNGQVDNSFSLNEAELMIRTDGEQDNASTNQSVHIDLQDYCTSSDSNASENGSSASYEDGSATEEGSSSDPQLGWTFYNRVVGQVNNILKKNPSPPRQEQSRSAARKPPPNYVLDRREQFDPENNWSKRVTFDGPTLEDHNMMGSFMQHARQYQPSMPYPHYRRGHDYLAPGNSERMQDFMMYNYANGYTNLSFSTLRYLDRNDVLPPQMQPGRYRQEPQVFQDQQKSVKHSKARNKSRAKELPTRGYQPNQARKPFGDPSSKLLDVTALKQQPKLF